MEGEIIGGWEAKLHSRPYMAHLAIQRKEITYICRGFLVLENFVLTATHCNGDKIIVSLGAHNIKQQEQSQQNIPVRCRIPHPKYNRKTHKNDIILLQLKHKAELNEQVRLIPLPLAHQRVQPGTVCSVAGWGRTNALSEVLPRTLQEVDLKVLDDEACLKYPALSFGAPITFPNSLEIPTNGPLLIADPEHLGPAPAAQQPGSLSGTLLQKEAAAAADDFEEGKL
ncbi:duodenase-1-like [Chelonoidis abingdonii]|uniref:duodenase-1-like n=1 Tax=Chelonoidis abingdonii TaxID=106734 RepID=UPI003F490B13